MSTPFDAKRWRVERARGHKRTTDPKRAQIHVQTLTATHGVSIRAIAETAGVTPSVISNLNRGICPGLKVTTEKAILAVTPQAIFNRPLQTGFVPNIGARRRIQALMAIGYRHQDLTPQLGFSTGTLLHQIGEWISKAKHDAVAALYEELWDTPGPAPATSRVRIEKAGYAPPMAWDDDTIDDPNAEPDLGEKQLKKDTIAEDVEFLAKTGATREEIAARLADGNWKTVEKQLQRAGRNDLVALVKTDVRDNARHASRRHAA